MDNNYVWEDGGYRCVRVYEDYVEKILNDECEEDEINFSNQNEIKIYKGFGEKYHILCPIDLEESTEEQVVMRREQTWDTGENCGKDLINSFIRQSGNDYRRFLDGFLRSRSAARLELNSIEVAAAAVDFIEQLDKIYDEEPRLYDYLMQDLWPRNTGILNKRLVILDYGGAGCQW